MGLMLDTSVVIDGERGLLDLRALVGREAAADAVYLPAIVVSELLHGWWRAPAGKRRDAPKQFIDDLLGSIPTVDFDMGAARKHAELWAALESRGAMIGAHDLLIAASCLHASCRLATLNEQEFQRVPGLELVEVSPYATAAG
jgi:predicted nucleic acid-binding protein